MLPTKPDCPTCPFVLLCAGEAELCQCTDCKRISWFFRRRWDGDCSLLTVAAEHWCMKHTESYLIVVPMPVLTGPIYGCPTSGMSHSKFGGRIGVGEVFMMRCLPAQSTDRRFIVSIDKEAKIFIAPDAQAITCNICSHRERPTSSVLRDWAAGVSTGFLNDSP